MTTFPDLAVINGIPYVSSLNIADHFQKRHADVLEAIRRVSSECPPEFIERNFSLNKYSDDIGRELPMYQLTRDGFTLLAMGVAGKKALAWKIRYIEAFNAMERELLKKAKPSPRQRRPRKALPAPEQLALCASPAALDEHAQKVQPLLNEVRQRGNEFMSSIFTLQSALRFRPAKMNPAVPDLSKALERTLPQFATAIGMNISALSDLLDVYSATLAATE